jgi:hypothetical protein
VARSRGGASRRQWRLEEAAFGVCAHLGHGGARGGGACSVAFQGRRHMLGCRIWAAACAGGRPGAAARATPGAAQNGTGGEMGEGENGLMKWFGPLTPNALGPLQGLARPGRAAKLDLGFAPHPGFGAFFVCPQQCGDGKNRPNKHRIPSKSRLGGVFLSIPGLPNTPLVYLEISSWIPLTSLTSLHVAQHTVRRISIDNV